MSDSCPGCADHRAKLTPDDRARIPLRESAHAYSRTAAKLFELVREHGWGHPLVEEWDRKLNAADDAMANAARIYAAGVTP